MVTPFVTLFPTISKGSPTTIFLDKKNPIELVYFHGRSESDNQLAGFDTLAEILMFSDATQAEVNAALKTQSVYNISGYPALEFYGYMSNHDFSNSGKEYFRLVSILVSGSVYRFSIVGGISSNKLTPKQIDNIWKKIIGSIEIK